MKRSIFPEKKTKGGLLLNRNRKLQSGNYFECPPDSYFAEEYKLLNTFRTDKTIPYDEALQMELSEAFDIGHMNIDQQLNRIKIEIKLRTKITALEVFKIGRLLYNARKLCRENGKGFKKWINDNLGFSYELGVNFMHVYKNCLGMMSIAIKLPLTILYKISAPSFPQELREFLFEQGNIESVTGMDLKKLVQKYKAGKFDEIRESVETWNKDYYSYRQLQFVLDRCRRISIDINNAQKSIEDKYGYYMVPYKGIHQERETLPEVNEIIKSLLSKLSEASSILEDAITEADVSIDTFRGDIEDALTM